MIYLFSDNGIVGHTQAGGYGTIASAYAIVDDKGKIIKEDCVVEKEATNNYGELKAIKEGIVETLQLGYKKVQVFSDSEIAVKCLTGEYIVESPVIKPVCLTIKQLIKNFEFFSIQWISRDQNTYADYLTAVPLREYRKTAKKISNKESCLKQLQEFVLNLEQKEERKLFRYYLDKGNWMGFFSIKQLFRNLPAIVVFDMIEQALYEVADEEWQQEKYEKILASQIQEIMNEKKRRVVEISNFKKGSSGVTNQIIKNVSIIEVAKKYGLKVDGRGMAECFMHEDNTPSLKFYENQGRFYCFGCRRGGNIIDFIKKMEELKDG